MIMIIIIIGLIVVIFIIIGFLEQLFWEPTGPGPWSQAPLRTDFLMNSQLPCAKTHSSPTMQEQPELYLGIYASKPQRARGPMKRHESPLFWIEVPPSFQGPDSSPDKHQDGHPRL